MLKMPKQRKFKKVKKDKYLAQRRLRSPIFEKGQPEYLSYCRPKSRSSNEEIYEDALPLPAFVRAENRLPMPKSYRKAVDIVTDELLEAYTYGEEARLVITFNQWYRDRQVYESIVYDCYRRLKLYGHNYVPVDETEIENYCYEFRAYLYALSLGYELKKNESELEMKKNDTEEINGKETDGQKGKKKRKHISFRRILTCVFPWAKCFRSRKVNPIQNNVDQSLSKESIIQSKVSPGSSLLSTSHSQIDSSSFNVTASSSSQSSYKGIENRNPSKDCIVPFKVNRGPSLLSTSHSQVDSSSKSSSISSIPSSNQNIMYNTQSGDHLNVISIASTVSTNPSTAGQGPSEDERVCTEWIA